MKRNVFVLCLIVIGCATVEMGRNITAEDTITGARQSASSNLAKLRARIEIDSILSNRNRLIFLILFYGPVPELQRMLWAISEEYL